MRAGGTDDLAPEHEARNSARRGSDTIVDRRLLLPFKFSRTVFSCPVLNGDARDSATLPPGSVSASVFAQWVQSERPAAMLWPALVTVLEDMFARSAAMVAICC